MIFLPLENQVKIYSVDTGNFYSNREFYYHRMNHKVRQERNKLKKDLAFYEEYLKEYGFDDDDLKCTKKGDFENVKYISGDNVEFDDLLGYYKLYKVFTYKRKKAYEYKDKILELIENKVQANIDSKGKHHIRELRFLDKYNKPKEPDPDNIISVFESTFTRTIGAVTDELSEDFMVVQTYYFAVMKDLIYHGFNYKGERYVYFTSSAGQIRLKKCVFVKESVWKECEKTLMCGLTVEEINSKGGCNNNKFLAYTALSSSSTDIWKEFDIDRTIVINDFETEVYGEYDFIDDTDFSIERRKGKVPVPHTDGCGMMLPYAFGHKQKNMMVRLPWIKGLLSVFPYDKFIKDKNCSPVIKDIYGVEHDVIAEDIQVIFTKSQFKLWKYYKDFNQYKEDFKKYSCTAGYTNKEEDNIKTASINYQMLQSLTDITDEEIEKLTAKSVETLRDMCSNINTVKNVFGATKDNQYKTAFQKAICLYPELLNDPFIKVKLKDIKDSLIKRFRSGKLKINGKYTFVLPDLYAACEYWFMGIQEPVGLLQDGQVYCRLYSKYKRLDCLRSPHLFLEHCVRDNVAYENGEDKGEDKGEDIGEWFNSDAIYTSTHDLISKVLAFDCDGDHLLVVADETLINIAERNVKKYDIVPLYYDMKKAEPSFITDENIYNSLVRAFTGGNIGQFSNNISKIWNDDVFVNGSEEEKRNAVDCIKRLTAQSNFCIDYAKTLYKPEFPEDIKKEIKCFTSKLLPYFFKYAKDKTNAQVQPQNGSLVNKIISVIPNPRINCKYIELGKWKKLPTPDYRLLLSNSEDEVESVTEFMEKYKDVIELYSSLAFEYMHRIDVNVGEQHSMDKLNKAEIKHMLVYGKSVEIVKTSMSELGYTDEELVDILVKYLYAIKDSKYKNILWSCYGDIIYKNLDKNIQKKTEYVQCEVCGVWYKKAIHNHKSNRCRDCEDKHRKERKLITQRERRAKLKNEVISTNDVSA